MSLWKIKDFSATQILREIKLCDFRVPKTAILTVFVAQNIGILGIFNTLKCGFSQKSKLMNSKVQNLPQLQFFVHKIVTFDFTSNLRGVVQFLNSYTVRIYSHTFLKKLRESTVFAIKMNHQCKVLISRNIFSVRVNFSFFHTVRGLPKACE